MERKEIIKEAARVIRRYLRPEYKILLFGSWAKGDAVETSDIDIGILGEKEVAGEVMRRIVHEVEGIPTLRSIDVVDLQSKSESFRKNALRAAQKLD